MSQHNEGARFGQKLHEIVRYVIRTKKKTIDISSFSGASGSLFVSKLANQSQTPKIILTKSYEVAEQVVTDLKFFNEDNQVNFFPHWDTMPYDNQSPDKGVLAVRFKALANVLSQTAPITVTTTNALMQRILPVATFEEHCLQIEVAKSFERSWLLRQLSQMGFVRVEMVEEKGEFSVRGEIIDIFPVSSNDPARLCFFDDELESIQYFDVETQRSIKGTQQLFVYPAQEIIYTDETTQNALKGIIDLKANTVPLNYHSIVESIQSRTSFPGVESLLPLFYQETATLLDYYRIPPEIIIFDHGQVKESAKLFFDEVASEYHYSLHEGNPTLDPERLFSKPDTFFESLKSYRQIKLQSLDFEANHSPVSISTVDNEALRSLAISPENASRSAVHNILVQLIEWNRAGVKIAIAVSSPVRAERIRQMLSELGLEAWIEPEEDRSGRKEFFVNETHHEASSFVIIPSLISKGFRWINHEGETKFALITGEEIFGPRQKKRRVKKSNSKHFFSSLGGINVGDYVVHVEYGIGQYEGLKKIKVGVNEADFLLITYHGGDKVYVPVDKFHWVQKYCGVDAGRPKVNKLGNKTWTKKKSKVQAEIDQMAEELVRVAAIRKAKKGVAFSSEGTPHSEFSMSFPYQETEDQENAIADVMRDMRSTFPMDRLVCGDVGFGKTEVAMRAAFRAVWDDHQVGILVPTTILAQQHFDSFTKRFESHAVKIELLSRFQTPKNIRAILRKLEEGKIDIVIGTHRLLSKDVKFNKLGLLVIDEEQRFGVRHKEAIKHLRTTVDTLTLSATPIPRTLHMSLVGLRDISIINTPPIDRRAIRTRLTKASDYVIQEAINREIRRNGQVFFIHNHVESIYQIGQYLNQLLPKARVAVAHGQMVERELEEIMIDFINKEYDVLLATTIVESGLDIPNVNTIIVNNSDKFGLSQLYQLRGRVGRSSVQAYAYLLTPHEKILTDITRKRLAILQELNHLGAGF